MKMRGGGETQRSDTHETLEETSDVDLEANEAGDVVAACEERPGTPDEQTDVELEKVADGEDAVHESMAVDGQMAAASEDELQVMTPVKNAPHEPPVVTPVRRQLSFGSEASSASDKSTRQVGLMRFWSPATASDKSMGSPPMQNLDEHPEPLAKRKRVSMEDAIRGMLRRGELSVGGQPLTLTNENIRSVHQSLRSSSRVGRPMKGDERRGILGGSTTNRRAKHEKPRQFEIPVSMKHAICKEMYEQRLRFANESAMLDEFSRAKSIRKDRLHEIWANRGEWAKLSQHERANASAKDTKGAKRARMRREGGGSKKEFPELVDKVRHFLDKERSHGHMVLPKQLAMHYATLLKAKGDELSAMLENETLSGPERKNYEIKRDKAMNQGNIH